MIDIDTLRKLAAETEIDEFTLLREYLQIHFLDRFYRNSRLEKTFFKGGTAIRLLFGSSRFSEDLDFTTGLDKSSLKKIIDSVVVQLSAEFSQISIRQIKTIEGYNCKLYLPTELSKQPLTIRLEFSQRESVKEPVVSPIETALPVAAVSLVEHLSASEILAEKMRALAIRKKGRDLFDLWYLLSKKTQVKPELIQQKFDFYRKKFLLKELLVNIKKWNEEDIDQDLRRFLPVSERKIIGELKRLTLAKLESTPFV